MLTASGLLMLLIELIIAGVFVWLLMWAVGYIGLPEPFAKVAKVVIVLIVILILVGLLMSMAGHPIIRWT